MIVMKFGGTSVQNATAIVQAGEIVRGRLARQPIVVVSALARVTDTLLKTARIAERRNSGDALALLAELRDRHITTARDLLVEKDSRSLDDEKSRRSYGLATIEAEIEEQFADLEGLVRSVATLGELTPRTQDAIASFGERLSSLIVAAAFRHRGINAEVVDSRELIVTDDKFTTAAPDFAETEARARSELVPLIESRRVPVAQGFIGATRDGVTTTLGRGGSDYSAAIVGATLGVESIEIWTDVDGLMTADPRIVPNARRIRVISFDEASELSYFGAKVLHPSTVMPAVERGIPVHIYNTLKPECAGTLIVASPKSSKNLIKSIAFKRGVTITNITSTRMLAAYGFLRAIFEVFDKHYTPVDVVTTSEVSVSITLDDTDHLDAIVRDLAVFGEIRVEREKAIVCVVGDNLKFKPGVAARVFSAIAKTNVNMISQGASEINLTFVIDEADVENVVAALHAEFFADVDSEVFD
jgi:aspartate kinase